MKTKGISNKTRILNSTLKHWNSGSTNGLESLEGTQNAINFLNLLRMSLNV